MRPHVFHKYLRKNENIREIVFACSFGAQVEFFFYKISLENIVTLSFLNSSSLSNTVLYCHATATQWMQWTILGSCVVQTSVEWRVLLSRLHLFPKIRLQPFPKRGCTRSLCRGCIHSLSRGCTCSLRRGCTRSLSRGYTHSLSRAAPIP